MTLKDIVERLERIEQRKAADGYDNHYRLIDDVSRLKLDIEMHILKTTGTL